MFAGRSLSAKLYFGFGLVLSIAACLGVFAFDRLVIIKASLDNITQDCLPGIFQIEQISGLAEDNMQKTFRAVLADSEEEALLDENAIHANLAETEKSLKAYEATIVSPRDREMFAAMQGKIAELGGKREAVLKLAKAGKMKEAEIILRKELEPAFDAYMEAIETLITYNKSNSDEESAAITAAVTASKSGILTGLALALAAGAAVGFLLSRSISSALNKVIATLSEGSEQVSSASGQVSESSQSMAEGASEQASSLEETSASLEEMSSMTKRNSENASQADSVATETRQAVEKSRVSMDRMNRAIGEIKNSSDETAKIVKTIDEIAFQTNLLALNAAVEAARAGDAGKGFAVVAEEVRNLAQRSAEAAKNTASLIEQSQRNADNGVAVSQEVTGILAQIVESVSKLGRLIAAVSGANQEQSKGIAQIGSAVAEMDKQTQTNAASAEESASASEELSAQAHELNEMVNALVTIVRGSRGLRSVPRNASGGAKPAGKSAGRDWSAVPMRKSAPQAEKRSGSIA